MKKLLSQNMKMDPDDKTTKEQEKLKLVDRRKELPGEIQGLPKQYGPRQK